MIINYFYKMDGVNRMLFDMGQSEALSFIFTQIWIMNEFWKEYNLTSSETQGLLAGTMRYFRVSDIFGAKVYFESWRAPGNLFLTNYFQKWSCKFCASDGPEKYFSQCSICKEI